MITVKTKEEIKILREGGKRLALIRDTLASRAVAGVSAQEIEDASAALFADSGGEPSFLNYRSKKTGKPFPARVCVSVNDAIVHGLPRPDIIFKEGDAVGIDVGLKYKGLFTDTAVTVLVTDPSSTAKLTTGHGNQQPTTNNKDIHNAQKGEEEFVLARKKHLLAVTKKALAVGIAAVRGGVTVGDIGFAIEEFVKSHGTPPHQLLRHCFCKFSEDSPDFSVHAPSCTHSQNESSNNVQRKSWCGGKFGIVRTLAGHGVGYAVHEEPHIPNFGKKGEGERLKAGMVIAIEPMLTLGGEKLVLDADGFTFRTADVSLSAHFEHTVAVTEDGAEILTLQ